MSQIIVPRAEFTSTVHNEQLDILRKFDKFAIRRESVQRFFFLLWHRRARKTTLGVNVLIKEAIRVPKTVFLYVAPTYKQAKNIVWTDPNMLFKWIPDNVTYKRNEQDLLIKFSNGSIIHLKGGDDPDSIKGIDCMGALIDEFALCKPEVWSEVLRPIMTQDTNRWAMFTTTPKGRNHAYKMWNVIPSLNDWHRSKLTADKSGLMSPEELEAARLDPLMTDAIYRQEYFCDFLADSERTLITYDALAKSARIIHTVKDTRRIVAFDPSGGGDACPVMCIEGGKIIDKIILQGEIIRDSKRITYEVMTMCHKWKTNYCIGDGIGIGWGVCDDLKSIGLNVQKFISSENKINPIAFLNDKAAAWWYVMKEVQDCRIPLITDQDVIDQLTVVKYDFDNKGRVKMESKDIVKKLIGRSPDDGDTFVYGVYGMQQVPADQNDPIERWRVNSNKRSKKKSYIGGAGGY